jgi:hypothetical protein
LSDIHRQLDQNHAERTVVTPAAIDFALDARISLGALDEHLAVMWCAAVACTELHGTPDIGTEAAQIAN